MSDPHSHAASSTSNPPPPDDAWRGLPFEVLRVLRAAALHGPAFTPESVAVVLRCEPVAVLERLQHAVDLGVPLGRADDGAFTLPAALHAALAATLLPALAHAWTPRPREEAPPAVVALPVVDPAIESSDVFAAAAEPEPAPDDSGDPGDSGDPDEIDADMFVSTKPPALPGSPPSNLALLRPRSEPQVFPRLGDAVDDGLQLDFLIVAREAADRGETQLAADTLRRALGQLGARPASAAHLRLRILGQIELGRLQWQAAGPELGFTLNQALGTLDAVRAEFGADASSDIAVELCQVIAGVCYDLGDLGSLARAGEELEVAGRLLQTEGETLRAARLLNDQAAVLMRMGEVTRAKDLLRESRKVFQSREADDPVTIRELAETDHLTAWLPLYAAMVPGREQEGYRMALERAAAAEQAYRKLDDNRELARVWETMGRLERHLERYEEAMQHLEAAGEIQSKLGDLTGLARTTEAMSDVLGQCGSDTEAIYLLRESVRFNHDKGSLIGLFFNRRAFTDLCVRLGSHPAHAAALQDLSRRLGQAEREVELGRSRSIAQT